MESTIRDWANAFSGYAFPSEDLVSIGIPVLKIGNVQRKCVTKEVDSYYNGELSQKLERYILQKNDFLIAMTGAGSVGRVGKMFECKGIFLVNQRIAIVRPKNEDDGFLYYWMSMPFVEKYLYSLGIGAGQPNISANDILNVKLNAPTLNVQRKIASILSSYDNLIENNNKRIRLLEQMAENLYKEWFVRFRFPGHEKAEFENGLPKGWKKGKLRDLAIEVGESEKAYNRDKYNHYLPIDKLPMKSMVLQEDDSIDNAESSLISFKRGDILFGAMRPYLYKVIIAPFAGLTRSTCFVINARESVYSNYLYLLMFQKSTVDYASTVAVGSTMPYDRWNDLARMNILIPNSEMVSNFNRIIAPILHRIIDNYQMNTNLSRQRDLLLPRLMSGKLEVKV